MDLGALLEPRSGPENERGVDDGNAGLSRKLTQSMNVGDSETFVSLHTPDVVVSVPGRNLLTGRHKGEEGIRHLIEQMHLLTEGKLSSRFTTSSPMTNIPSSSIPFELGARIECLSRISR